ncbi:uncharacterized protein LOC134823702 [Bolinopsis microptera]|uniref:uncharacterized protein LOC134823702 n=1 Tax=Bolinopsis microptera TaxID=2820187 RepID=UPI0030796D03
MVIVYDDSTEFTVDYDKLITAVGTKSNTFGVPGVETDEENIVQNLSGTNKHNLFFLKQIEHCFFVPLLCARREKEVTNFLIVGCDPTSIEFASELYDFLQYDVSRWYPDLANKYHIVVVEAGEYLLGSFSETLYTYFEKKFVSGNIVTLTGESAQEVKENSVILKSGDILPDGVCVWSTGNKKLDFFKSLYLRLDRQHDNNGMLTKVVELVRGDAGFGFSVIGGSDTYLPPMVFTLAPSKPAHNSGQVEKGDRILNVNGMSVSDLPSKNVIQLINESGTTLKLSLQDDPDLKRRLNAFIQAKERGSGSPAPAPAAPTVSVEEVAPVNTVISPGSGRRLYQPRSYSNLSNGGSTRKPEPAAAREPEPPPEPPNLVEEDSRIPYNIPADISPNVSASSEKYKLPNDHLYNDLDTARGNTGLKQTSLSFLSEDQGTPTRTYSGLRDNDSRNETEVFDVNPTFTPPPPPPAQPANVPVYAKVNKKRSNKSPPTDDRPFSGIAQVYSPPPQYETEPSLPPELPPELPPDIPPRETAESCARRLFYQEGCVPEDVSFTLASGVPFDVEVSQYYMQYFNFDNYKLDDAVRVFVERAPLIGENSTREAILFHLSKHLYETNTALRQQLPGPEEIHTLVCALMMLNTDLHGGMVDRKMTYNQFESNLRNTEANVDKGTLKELYNGIKSKPIIVNTGTQEAEPAKPMRRPCPSSVQITTGRDNTTDMQHVF